jgi:gas vesicle protein
MNFLYGLIVGIVVGSMGALVCVTFCMAAKRGDAMLDNKE